MHCIVIFTFWSVQCAFTSIRHCVLDISFELIVVKISSWAMTTEGCALVMGDGLSAFSYEHRTLNKEIVGGAEVCIYTETVK